MFLHTKKSVVIRAVFAVVICVTFFVGCASRVLKKVEEQDSAILKLIIARDMINQTRYSLALRILKKIKEEHSSDAQIVVEVDYEIAFVALSRKLYKEAQQKLEDITAQYDNLENKNVLPQWPYYLSKKLLETTVYPAIEKRNKKKPQKLSKKE